MQGGLRFALFFSRRALRFVVFLEIDLSGNPTSRNGFDMQGELH